MVHEISAYVFSFLGKRNICVCVTVDAQLTEKQARAQEKRKAQERIRAEVGVCHGADSCRPPCLTVPQPGTEHSSQEGGAQGVRRCNS